MASAILLGSTVDRTVAHRRQVEHDLLSFANTSLNVLALFVVPGGQAVGGHQYKLRLVGDIQNSTALPINLTMQWRRNTTALVTSGAISIPNHADFRAFTMEWEVWIDNDFDINSYCRLEIGSPVTAASMGGVGGLFWANAWRQQALADVDWAADTTFDFTAQWATASTSRRQIYDLTETLTTGG